jgi:hypothetical protein
MKQCCTFPESPAPSPSPSPSSNTCKINSGASGICISTTACQKQGGVSEAGHCPGSASIQCCTFPDSSTPSPSPKPSPAPSDNGCAISSGQHGECISTSSCSKAGGKSTAGFCPGPTDIQVSSSWSDRGQYMADKGIVLYLWLLHC